MWIINEVPIQRGKRLPSLFRLIQFVQNLFRPGNLLLSHIEGLIDNRQLIRVQGAFSLKPQTAS